MPVGQEPEMPDADEAGRQDMQKEAPKKLLDSKLHHALLVVMAESRQRKLTCPLASSSSLWLEMAIRCV